VVAFSAEGQPFQVLQQEIDQLTLQLHNVQVTPGPQGVPRLTGPAGPAGAIGPVGPQGQSGATGAQGIKGDTGATGAQGIQGLKGNTGTAGPSGTKRVFYKRTFPSAIDLSNQAWKPFGVMDVYVPGPGETALMTGNVECGAAVGQAICAYPTCTAAGGSCIPPTAPNCAENFASQQTWIQFTTLMTVNLDNHPGGVQFGMTMIKRNND
jgi:hypothetical protein